MATYKQPYKKFVRLMRHLNASMNRVIRAITPKQLFLRILFILIVPVVLVQTLVVLAYLNQHWRYVSQLLSRSLAQDIATLVEIYDRRTDDQTLRFIEDISDKHLQFSVSFLAGASLPAPQKKPFLDYIDQSLSEELARVINRPFWIESIGRSDFIEVRIKLDNLVMRITSRRSQSFVETGYDFLIIASSLMLLIVLLTIMFLRNQIKPIVQLSAAMDAFGKGEEISDMRVRGASEVRRAARAFFEMKTRIERHVEQRTAMLTGISHDLKTILTRFKLEIALLKNKVDQSAVSKDINEMQKMLDGYLEFARSNSEEPQSRIDLKPMLEDLVGDFNRQEVKIILTSCPEITLTVKAGAFRRAIHNILDNACRYGKKVCVSAHIQHNNILILIEDDGVGIPEEKRSDVFRPFIQLEDDKVGKSDGTGLGLSLVRDVIRAHGGNVDLGESSIGGLLVQVSLPL